MLEQGTEQGSGGILTILVMDTHTIATITAGLVGLLIGLTVAEIAYRRAAHHANHVVPATIVNNYYKTVKQKQVYIGLLIVLLLAQAFLDIPVPTECYTLLVLALVGGDIQKIGTKHTRLK